MTEFTKLEVGNSGRRQKILTKKHYNPLACKQGKLKHVVYQQNNGPGRNEKEPDEVQEKLYEVFQLSGQTNGFCVSTPIRRSRHRGPYLT